MSDPLNPDTLVWLLIVPAIVMAVAMVWWSCTHCTVCGEKFMKGEKTQWVDDEHMCSGCLPPWERSKESNVSDK